jgi:exopolysaccharide biosynthesis polyprenyl glycosylphosphotransferase
LSNAVSAAKRLGIDTVAVTASPGITPAALRNLAWELEDTGIGLIVAPALTDVAGPRIHITPVAGLPLLHVDTPELSGGAQAIKSVFDRGLATVVLVLLSPIMAAIALAVRLESGGPVLFRQVREGRGGEQFRIAKFRSMHVDGAVRLRSALGRDPEPGEVLKLRDDPRITKVGAFLRRTSLDELPQLLDVVRGDMALVGPRPLQPGEATFNGIDVGRRNRLKPGITGLWQVSGRSDLDWAERARLDSYYVENWSLISDLLILLRTIFAVFRRRGAF